MGGLEDQIAAVSFEYQKQTIFQDLDTKAELAHMRNDRFLLPNSDD